MRKGKRDSSTNTNTISLKQNNYLLKAGLPRYEKEQDGFNYKYRRRQKNTNTNTNTNRNSNYDLSNAGMARDAKGNTGSAANLFSLEI